MGLRHVYFRRNLRKMFRFWSIIENNGKFLFEDSSQFRWWIDDTPTKSCGSLSSLPNAFNKPSASSGAKANLSIALNADSLFSLCLSSRTDFPNELQIRTPKLRKGSDIRIGMVRSELRLRCCYLVLPKCSRLTRSSGNTNRTKMKDFKFSFFS